MNIVVFFYENFWLILLGLCLIGYYWRRSSQKLHAISQPLSQSQEQLEELEFYVQDDDEAEVLSFAHLCKILESYQFADNNMIPMIARVMSYASKKECLYQLEIAQKLAQKDQKLISLQHVLMANLYMNHGAVVENSTRSDEDKIKTAFHEAGHAVGFLYQPSDHIVHLISIKHREQANGFVTFFPIIQASNGLRGGKLTWFERQVMVGLGGVIAEQVFGFPGGGILEDDDLDNDNTVVTKEDGFDNMLFRILFSTDFEKVRSHIISILSLQNHPVIHILKKESLTDEEADQINDAIEKVMKVYYERTYDFIVKHKDKVEQLANLLLKEETLHRKQIYESLGIVMPHYDFEK